MEIITDRTLLETRPYQQRIVIEAVNAYKTGLRSILIESPTGSGKSVMGLMIAKALHDNGLRIGWVAMRRHLLKQVENENRVKGFNLPLVYISMFEKAPDTALDVLIVDEAQHDVTGSMAHIHALVQPRHILGLSATPFRADRIKLCFDKVIKDAGIAALIKDGYLSAYQHYAIPEWNVDTVTEFYLREPQRWGKSIMYFHRLIHCEEARDILRKHSVTCEIVDGAADTDTILNNFLNNKISVLINCLKLTEGFDSPDLKTVFCRPSCKSVTMQMCGRVLRKHHLHEYKQIVQSFNTPYPFQKTALANLQHLWQNDSWRTVEVNPNIDAINNRTIKALAKVDTKLPKFILRHKPIMPKRIRNRDTRID